MKSGRTQSQGRSGKLGETVERLFGIGSRESSTSKGSSREPMGSEAVVDMLAVATVSMTGTG